MQGAQVQSLVGELRWHMLHSVAKKKKRKKEFEKLYMYMYNWITLLDIWN